MGLFDFLKKEEEPVQAKESVVEEVVNSEVSSKRDLGIPDEYPEAVKEIHREFFTSSDKLLIEAQSIIKKSEDKDIVKGSRLNKLGFKNTDQAKRSSETVEEVKRTKKEMEYALYYKKTYPLNKFITANEVRRICEKYGLACAPVSRFTGFVPEKNLSEIENFSGLLDLDKVKDIKSLGTYNEFEGKILNDGGESAERYSGVFKKIYEEKELKICAPRKDMDLSGMETEDGYFFDEKKDIPDPIVLTHCKGGYLILTAWGPEASDPLVVNEINN